jgi:hypothetical protein
MIVSSASPSAAKLRPFLPLVVDVAAPVLVYYALHALGAGDVLALTAGGVLSAANALVGVVRDRRVDKIALLVLFEFALSIVLLFVTGDPRFLLLKPSLYIAIGGAYCLATAFAGRPLVYETARPFATKGDAEREAAWERCWTASEPFRRELRLLTVLWGVGFLLEAVARAALVYSLPVDEAVLAAQAPLVVLFIALGAISRVRVPRLAACVDRQQAA